MYASYTFRHQAHEGTLLLLGFCRRNCLSKAEMCFRVGEFLDLLDLQVPVFVGNDVSDEDRFAVHLHSDQGVCFVGDLWGRWNVKCVRC